VDAPLIEEYRIIRCANCGGFVLKVEIIKCKPGSQVLLNVNTNCRNRHCREENEFQIAVDDAEIAGRLAANHRK
jgi:phage FluMu protein Com